MKANEEAREKQEMGSGHKILPNYITEPRLYLKGSEELLKHFKDYWLHCPEIVADG